MKSVRPLLAVIFALAIAGTAVAGAQKQSAAAVRFHAEGGSEGGTFSQPVELINPKRMTNMQSHPLVTEREIKSFHPFPASDGSGTFGASFRLDAHGSNLLSQHTMSRRGTFLLAYFNGRHIIDLYIDRGVTDGIVTIPRGLTAPDISLLEISFPRMGQEKSGPAKKKAPAKPKPTPPPKAADMPRMQPAMVRQPDGTLVPARGTGAAPVGDVAPRPLSPIGQ